MVENSSNSTCIFEIYKNPLERNFRFVEIPLIKVYTHICKVLTS